MKPYKIYLDVCCFNRPFDNQTQERIQLETEAIIQITTYCQTETWTLITSDFIDREVDNISNVEQNEKIRIILSTAKIKVVDSGQLDSRIEELKKMGFKTFDAAHIASAERAKADIFLSTDDRLVKRAKRYPENIRVKVENPLIWLKSITGETNDTESDPS